jgi:predicted PurR-regulated permease PerM
VVANELSHLSGDFVRYRENLVQKVEGIRGPLGSVSRLARWTEQLEQRLGGGGAHPPKVEVVEPQRVLTTAREIVAPLLEPLAIAGVVAVLAIFLLLQREDLRDRLIRLIGDRDLGITTEAMNEAGERVSRYLGAQAGLCLVHGTVVALGLTAIGVPGALLWGALSALLRFVPYLGPWIAAALPISLSLVAFAAWTPFLLTCAFFIALELVSNNVLEPWICGARVGLSPFAVVLSAVFWTWLWGGVGLVLATPLTVCLVVLGKYIPELEFLTVLLADRAPLDPDVRLYHRVLALEGDEVASMLAEGVAGEGGLVAVTDALVLPTLRRLARDAERGSASSERSESARELLAERLEALVPPLDAPGGSEVLSAPAPGSPWDAIASAWLTGVLRANGIAVQQASESLLASEVVELADKTGAKAVVISALTRNGEWRARHLAKRLLAHASRPEVVLCHWNGSNAPDPPSSRQRFVSSARQLLTAVAGLRDPS